MRPLLNRVIRFWTAGWLMVAVSCLAGQVDHFPPGQFFESSLPDKSSPESSRETSSVEEFLPCMSRRDGDRCCLRMTRSFERALFPLPILTLQSERTSIGALDLLSLARTWQFQQRAAPTPRHPTLLS